VFLLLACSVVLSIYYRPYLARWETLLEVSLLSLATTTYLESILVGVGDAFFKSTSVSTALTAINALVKVGLVVLLGYRTAQTLRKSQTLLSSPHPDLA
jgi:hypothetical protein